MSFSFSWGWISIVIVILSWVLHALRKKRNNKSLISLPPGPKGLPILGNLLMLGEFPHRDLHRLSEEHGSIMYLRLGFIPTIVVSSPEAAELFLKTYDLIFASRPFNEAANHISYEQKGLSFTEYGPYWRNVRKLCTLELLSTLKIESFKDMRREELGSFIESLKEASRAKLEVNLSAKVLALSTDMSCLMVFGKKHIHNDNKKGFHAVVQEGMQLAARFNIADYIPYIGSLDIQGLTKRMKAVSKVFDDMFEKIIDEHVDAGDKGHQRDFVDVMLSFMESKEYEFQFDRSNIKAIILDMLVGSMDTSSTAIEWAFAELLKHPNVMKKVQQELERVVGLDRLVEESDLMSLEYLEMVVKESLRLHPVAPLLIPHESTEDCTVNGYHIPRKSRIIVNSWALGRDPKVWDDPEKFIPESVCIQEDACPQTNSVALHTGKLGKFQAKVADY
ncbi:Cytochrome p450 [Thalictrum thalictroides]|uniref:Cytochrome p450 n=1 Tax=Thalictrum thalictroides TaxID=46969 RepID=A0A7J6W163_THATH|nr:Cytochrome p450 [Thalictrum thalictroides]